MAYGARLESVLGASPQGFESPILRIGPIHNWIGEIATKVKLRTPVEPLRAVRGPFASPICSRESQARLSTRLGAAKSPASSENEQGFLPGEVELLDGSGHFETTGGATALP